MAENNLRVTQSGQDHRYYSKIDKNSYERRDNNSNIKKDASYKESKTYKDETVGELFEFRGFKHSKRGGTFDPYESAGNNLFARDILRYDSQDRQTETYLKCSAESDKAHAYKEAHAQTAFYNSAASIVGSGRQLISNVVDSVSKAVSSIVKSISEKRQKFFEFAFSDSKHYYNAYASNEALKYSYKNQQKQRRHERKMQKRSMRYSKSQNRRKRR